MEKPFIKETILKKDNAFLKYIKKLGFTVISAAIFGMVALFTFVFFKPYADKMLGEPESTKPVSIEADTEITESIATENMSENISEEAVEDIVNIAIETYDYTIKDLDSLHHGLRDLSESLEESLVQIYPVKNETDWFNNATQTTTEAYSGLIIALSDESIFIMAPDIKDYNNFKIRLYDGTEVSAKLLTGDTLINLSVLSIDKDGFDVPTLEALKAVKLGNSYKILQGDILLAVGSPLSIPNSMDYGFVSYIAKNTSIVDGSTRLIYVNKALNTDYGSFLINTDGELVAWLSNQYDNTSYSVAFAISDFKTRLEKILNAIPIAYLGILPNDFSIETENEHIQGVYVREVVSTSPAYNAGLQAGDIITQIGDMEVRNVNDYKNALENINADQEVSVKFMRASRDSYAKLELNVNVGSR